MDVYAELAKWTGWPAVVAFLILGSSYAYVVLRNRLALANEKIEWLRDQLEATKDFRADVLAQRLADRLRLLSEELERLHADHETSQESIRQKETELSAVREEIKTLGDQFAGAQETLRVITEHQLVCPHCGAPLVAHEFFPDSIEYQGRELDYEHESVLYECGFAVRDGRVRSPCPSFPDAETPS